MGLAKYFRKFVKNFAVLSKSLTKLLQKDVPRTWSTAQQNAVNKIKNVLTQRLVLAIFNPQLVAEVHTDASKTGVEGILNAN